LNTSTEEPLGVVWGGLLKRNGKDSVVAFTRSSVFTAVKKVWFRGCVEYFGPGSKAKPAALTKAIEYTADLREKHDLEITKNSVLKITFRRPDLFDPGRVVFNTKGGDIEFDLPSAYSTSLVWRTVDVVLPSLTLFAPDRFYGERDGALIVDSMRTKVQRDGWFGKRTYDHELYAAVVANLGSKTNTGTESSE
jgi:hypothetical protein